MRELLARVGADELAEWMAYEQITGPIGGERADLHTGLIASTVANANRGKGRAFKVADFVPTWDRPPQTWRDQLAIVTALNTQLGGSDRRGDHRV